MGYMPYQQHLGYHQQMVMHAQQQMQMQPMGGVQYSGAQPMYAQAPMHDPVIHPPMTACTYLCFLILPVLSPSETVLKCMVAICLCITLPPSMELLCILRQSRALRLVNLTQHSHPWVSLRKD
jgi:hypothetical protein